MEKSFLYHIYMINTGAACLG